VHPSLKISLLGGFRASRPGEDVVPFASKKAQALLAYLAVERERPQTRETLAALLWGNTGEDRARHNLRQSLSRIRQSFGDIVAGRAELLSLDSAMCATDVAEFDGLSGAETCDELRRCLDLYRGEFLSGVEPREPGIVDWLLVVRGRFRQAACDVAHRLVLRLVDEGREEEAISALQDLLVIDPADEIGHRKLMQLLAAAGRRSDALRQFQRCRDALKRELGAEPDPATVALCMELQRNSATGPGNGNKVARKSALVPAIAVLPFENRSREDAAYFADGIAEDLTTALSSFQSLAVISRGSSFHYRHSDLPDRRIADELGAQYLLRGSVQRSGNRIRINVQLMDALAGLQVWGHRYDRELEDVFALQDEITSVLVSTLAGRVEAARLNHARNAPAERLDAYDLVLRGKDHHHRFTADDTRTCIDMFERAVERDPSYAVAHAWLACGYGLAMVFNLEDVSTLVDKSQAAAEKGLRLDENESECHRVLAQVQLTRRNLERAQWHQDRALFLNPNDDRILCAQGEILTFVGRAEEGEEWIRKAQRLNPYHPERYWTHLARALIHQDRFGEAMAALDKLSLPRQDDLVYRIVAGVGMGNRQTVSEAMKTLGTRFPEFDVSHFVETLPYTDSAYRDDIAKPLLDLYRG